MQAATKPEAQPAGEPPPADRLLAVAGDYTAFMYLGRLIEYGATPDIFTKPVLRETEAYVTGRFG